MENNQYQTVEVLASQGKAAAGVLMIAETPVKNKALELIASAITANKASILEANQLDVSLAGYLSESMRERLMLTPKRLDAIAESVLQVAALPDPVGEADWFAKRPNGLQIIRRRVPLGLVGVIYESRPNVTVDTAVLCLKSGNAVLLRGGKEAYQSNKILTEIMRKAISKAGLPADCVSLVEDTTRQSANTMMRLTGLLDVLIPRGGHGLIRSIVENARVPVIETGAGCCHAYVDAETDIKMAIEIAVNAKCSRPSVCNAIETLLIHKSIAPKILPLLKKHFERNKVELRGCRQTCEILAKEIKESEIKESEIKEATEEDWYAEYSSLILAIRIVDSVEEAIKHINKYGTHHSEVIITTNYFTAHEFTSKVDSACVYVNASTRFTDGGEFGLGAEIGISTQKLHARGPMGLNQLTSVKYEINGTGQIR